MQKYLYLTKPEWAAAWILGGQVPISLASSYLGKVRSGTQTPDETVIHDSPVDLHSYAQYGVVIKGARRLTMAGNICNGRPMPDVFGASLYEEDGIILSFSNKPNSATMHRLGKAVCIEIDDIESLKQRIDMQLSVVGEGQECAYTHDHQRNHFLKSVDDSWQDEYRLFWPILESRDVWISAGTGRLFVPPDVR